MIYLLIGQPGSGKTTLGKRLLKRIKNSILIDGDINRDQDTNYDYTKVGREKNLQSILKKCKENYVDRNIIVSCICPYTIIREEFFKIGKVKPIFLYTNQIRGKESYKCIDFELPDNRFLRVNTDKTITHCVNKILLNE